MSIISQHPRRGRARHHSGTGLATRIRPIPNPYDTDVAHAEFNGHDLESFSEGELRDDLTRCSMAIAVSGNKPHGWHVERRDALRARLAVLRTGARR